MAESHAKRNEIQRTREPPSWVYYRSTEYALPGFARWVHASRFRRHSPHQTTGQRPDARIFWSAETNVRSLAIAVATIRRSIGSPWNGEASWAARTAMAPSI